MLDQYFFYVLERVGVLPGNIKCQELLTTDQAAAYINDNFIIRPQRTMLAVGHVVSLSFNPPAAKPSEADARGNREKNDKEMIFFSIFRLQIGHLRA